MIGNRIRGAWQSWHGMLVVSLGVTALVLGVRYLGGLEKEELTWLDRFFRWRPVEATDERVIIIGITEEDIENYQPYPFTDATLAELLNRIEAQKPRAIALDIARNIPVPPGTSKLNEVFQTTPNLIGIGKLTGVPGDRYFDRVPFPPLLQKKWQVGDVSVIEDEDGVVRRAFLYPLVDGSELSRIPSLGMVAALDYLWQEGIELEEDSQGWVKLGHVSFEPFRAYDGSYIRADEGSYQIRLNWRGPSQSLPHVSVTQVMEGQIPDDLFRERLVFIGAFAPSLKDDFETPYSRERGDTPQQMYGVEIQAHLASQVLAAVLDGRPRLKTWNEAGEILWIFGWALLPAGVGWSKRRMANYFRLTVIVLGTSSFLTAVIIGGSYFLFLQSWWIPVLFPLISLWGGTLGILGYIYINKIQEINVHLEETIEIRTQEVNKKNQELYSTLERLKQTQATLIAQEKLASLGTLVAGIAHEIRNPIHLIQWNVQLADRDLQILQQSWAETGIFIEDIVPELLEETERLLSKVQTKMARISEQATRSDLIVGRLMSYVRRDKSEPSLIRINQLLAESIELVREAKTQENQPEFCKIETNLAEEVGEIEGIETDLKRAWVNLLENAWDAVEEKSQKVSNNFVPTILVTTRNLEEAVEIVISDNGEGISSEIRPRIFDPFFSKKDSGKGTGLGLFFVHEIIVGEHQGKIEVQSEESQGTRFIVVLPRKFENFSVFQADK